MLRTADNILLSIFYTKGSKIKLSFALFIDQIQFTKFFFIFLFLGDLKEKWKDCEIDKLNSIFNRHFTSEDPENFELKVNEILFKSGNKLFIINLQ